MSFHQLTIISGGQTGADRAALDFAIAHDMPHDGWCPRGRRAEDGRLDRCYRLRETPSPSYAQRTLWNVRDSDATAVFAIQRPLTGGTLLTVELARKLGRPILELVEQDSPIWGTAESFRQVAQKLCEFIEENQIARLNVAGPRAEQHPRVALFVTSVLSAAYSMSSSQTQI